MRSRGFTRRVGAKSLRRKRYFILFLYALGLSIFIFLSTQITFLKPAQDQGCATAKFCEEGSPFQRDRKPTTTHGVSGSGSVSVENSFQRTELQFQRGNKKAKIFKQRFSLPSHPNQPVDNRILLPDSERSSSNNYSLFPQEEGPLVGFAHFMYLRLFPQLAIVALKDSKAVLQEHITEEESEPADEENFWEWVHGPDPFLTSSDMHLVPLRKVRIQLLRKRANRRRWVDSPSLTATDDGDTPWEPIVSLMPVESPTLHFPKELLVEEYLPGDTGVNYQPDSRYVVPITASTVAVTQDGRMAAELVERRTGRTTRLTAKATKGFNFFPQFSSVNYLANHPQPLIEAIPAENVKLSPPQLLWHPDGNCEDMTVCVQLFKVKPPFVSVGGIQQKLKDSTRTEALAASFNLHGVKQLYGLPRREGTVRDMFSNRLRLRIPLDGFRYTASINGYGKHGRPSEVGVLPLIFLELDRSSSFCSSLRPQEAREPRTVGILWFNGAPFSVSTGTLPLPHTVRGGDDTYRNFTVQLNFTSSAAATRIYLLPGPTPAQVLKQYYTLTGFPTLPPLMALGYHYHTRAPLTSKATVFVRAINRAFWDSRVPLDSIGLTSSTISQNGTSLTWNRDVFRDPMSFQVELWYYGRRSFIVRVVPTIPIVQSSPLYYEGRRGRHFISLDPDDDTWWVAFTKDGWRSHVIDFVSPTARQWFSRMFKYKRFTKSTNFTYVALQHAAPVLLGTPDSTLPMSVGHTRGLMHRQVHNVFNTYAAMAVHHGLLHRNVYHRRSFVTSENYFIGIHRFGGVFLNYRLFSREKTTEAAPIDAQLLSSTVAPLMYSQIAWQQLRDSIHDCVSLGIVGIPFAGVNVAGETSENEAIWSKLSPSEREELLTRWYQAASVFPLMQTEELVGMSPREGGVAALRLALAVRYPGVRDAVRFRYALLPYLYTSIWRTSEDGCPMLLAPITEKQSVEAHEQEDYAICLTIGSELVACPCVKLLDSSVSWQDAKIQLPHIFPGARYSNYWTGGWWEAGARVPLWPRAVNVDKTWLGKPKSFDHSKTVSTNTPVWPDLLLFQRVGSIVPTFLALDGQMVSTRAPANYSLTIALPSELRSLWQDSLRDPNNEILLAGGEVYWDDGTQNTQTQPPMHKAQPHQEHASLSKQTYCHVRLECYLKGGTLMLSGTQGSSSCVDSLNALAFTWNDLPPQMDAWLKPLVEQQEGVRHAAEVKRNNEEDKGLHSSKRNAQHSTGDTTVDGAVDDTGHYPNTTIRDNLYTTFSLHYVRFLVASLEDAAWLSQRLGSLVEAPEEANSLTFVVRLAAPPAGGELSILFKKNGVCSLFGVSPLITESVERSRSNHSRKTSPWVITFKE